MENVKNLENYISSLGLFGKTITLTIKLENAFEGFYGKASEDWETRVTIQVESPDEKKCKNVKVVGLQYQRINDVAGIVLQQLKQQ